MSKLSQSIPRLLFLSAILVSAGCGGDDDKDPLTPGDATLLTSGTAVTGISGSENSLRLYKIVVPSGAAELTVATTGGTGDMDLYVRHGAVPTVTESDCESFGPDNDELCSIPSPPAGDWFILLEGFEAYSGVSLTATVIMP